VAGSGNGPGYFLYTPAQPRAGAPVLVAVHGISRNARAHATRIGPLAATHGALVVAPLYDTSHFSDYQRLGRGGERPHEALHHILEHVSTRTGADTERFRLFGYSGGAQFAHRYALLFPGRVMSLGLGAAGWYTFPETGKRFPFGLRPDAYLNDAQVDFAGFLDLRIRVFVGDRDNQRDPDLNCTRRIDRQQGATRVERATRWVNAVRTAALGLGRRADIKLRILSGAGHSFEQNVREAGLDRRIIAELF
jgi:pimeloyl-ACP methyl ester carboxylesterase